MKKPLDVLLIDDEPIVGKRLMSALTKMGCAVETFVNPKEAVERIDSKDFDIVVTDMRMPEIDGFQILSKTLEKKPDTKVIVITGYAMMSMAREAMEKGAFDFIAKPFKPDDLRKVISKAALAMESNAA